MKITNLSIAAIAAVGMMSVAHAEVTLDEVKGNAKIWYETADSDGGGENGLFDQHAAGFTGGDAAISVEATGKLGSAMGYGVKYTAVDTLGLENNVVSSRRTPAAGADPLATAHWFEKAYVTYKMGNTLAKIGRQHLNTPLAFTEAWNVSANSFDAAVLVNTDIENVTLIGAYVGRGNGGNPGIAGFSTVQPSGKFGTYVADGAYAAAALVKPVENAGINAWYYNVEKVADAVWLDADYTVSGINVGALYAQMQPKGTLDGSDDTSGFAVKAGAKAGPVSLFGAYSSISKDGVLPIANTATNFKKTKLPTAGVYTDGVIVAQPGSDTFKLKASAPVGPVTLTAQYISTTNDINKAKDVDEFDVIIGTKLADINVKAIYINRTFDQNQKAGNVGNSDSNHVRIIAGYDF
ncbi:MAG TPA: outer membrane porin, OprD family [Campylobacterales bacterium]|nr:outer membrane porin, OprD family [Campylobacterales bacterium]